MNAPLTPTLKHVFRRRVPFARTVAMLILRPENCMVHEPSHSRGYAFRRARSHGRCIVEVDETFIGQKPETVKQRGYGHKNAVLSLIDRKSGEVRSFHVEGTRAADLLPIIKANVAKETAMMTDEAGQYLNLGEHFASHESVNYGAGEYGRGDVHTNTVEGYYSVFKRGMKGMYQHCSERHLHRYVAEFDFRYSNRIKLGVDDAERADRAVRAITESW
jgi:transposase-like protein